MDALLTYDSVEISFGGAAVVRNMSTPVRFSGW